MKKSYQYLLLDLDGTVTDSMEGITRCVEYALNHFGITVKDRRELFPFIGPPLIDSFKEFYHFTDEQAHEASLKYHERFSATGLYENAMYEGIDLFLQKAVAAGKVVMLATSKPGVFAEKIIDHFQLTPYFSFIGGSGMDGARHTKADVIDYVLSSAGVTDLTQAVMIGDRKHDIIGAKAIGIDSVGVLYGYGDYEELKTAGADYIVKDIKELESLLL